MVRNWLFGVCGLILLIILVGGITRITHSGLSIVDWRPLMGTIPPLNEADWQEVFERYKAFPEYQQINRGMTLSEFKWIFFWEYLHRLIGRLIGLAFAIPLVFFWVRGKLGSGLNSLKLKLVFGFLLGGGQGVLGWYMVQSGLIYQPHVSHFRLASHLGLALLILGFLYWVILDLGDLRSRARKKSIGNRALLVGAAALPILIFIQITFGAFMAGLHAGLMANTFPLMNGEFFPSGLLGMDSLWTAFLSHPLGVQWVHRWLGVGVVGLAIALAVWVFRGRHRPLERVTKILLGLVLFQFVLGVATLLARVPMGLALAHQMTAVFLLLASLHLLHRLKYD